jgi:hypothetical protein
MTTARDDRPRHHRWGRPLGAYRSREAAYPDPPPLRLGDNEMRLVIDKASAQARPSNTSQGRGAIVPDRKPLQAIREPILEPGSGEGVLSILADGGDTAPVVAVDGTPVSVGNGQLDIVLRAGAHTIEVQNRYTVDPVVVQIEPGGRHRIQFFEDWLVGHRVLGDLPETYAFVPTNAGCWSWFVLVALACGLPYSLAAGFVGDSGGYLTSAIITAAISLVLIAVGIPLHRRAKAKYHRDIADQRRTFAREPVPYRTESGTDAILVGANPAALPPIPVGAAAIDLHLECGRHLWAGHRKAATGSFLARAWTRPPLVRIDGVEQPRAWGHWRYHVPPGAHRVTVTVDGRPLNLDVPDRHTGAPEKDRDLAVETRSGQAVSVKAEAHVYAIWRPATGDVESYQPRLWLEAA